MDLVILNDGQTRERYPAHSFTRFHILPTGGLEASTDSACISPSTHFASNGEVERAVEYFPGRNTDVAGVKVDCVELVFVSQEICVWLRSRTRSRRVIGLIPGALKTHRVEGTDVR
ncbi:hypothetical protein TNCV_4447711 [Trichonephila clavipes]|nr:hypothetical protein TNCV_4447711 [Trichonephila clavipes]